MNFNAQEEMGLEGTLSWVLAHLSRESHQGGEISSPARVNKNSQCELKRPRAAGRFIIKEQTPKHGAALLLPINQCIPKELHGIHIPLTPLLSPSQQMCLKLEKDRIKVWKRFPTV